MLNKLIVLFSQIKIIVLLQHRKKELDSFCDKKLKLLKAYSGFRSEKNTLKIKLPMASLVQINKIKYRPCKKE